MIANHDVPITGCKVFVHFDSPNLPLSVAAEAF